MKFELKHLEAFVAAARHGSFTRAAAALRISQPAFTTHIQQLEERLGVGLIDRRRRPMELTPMGRALAGPLERALGDIELAFRNLEDLSHRVHGEVAVAALPSLAAGILAGVIASFRAAHPGIIVRLRDAVSGRIAAMVKSGNVDFGFASPAAGETELDFQPLFSDRMGAILRRGSSLSQRRLVTLAELAVQPLILMDRDSSVRAAVEGPLTRLPRYAGPAFEVTYISTALAMVRSGLGIAVVPETVWAMEDRRRLCWIPIEQPRLDRDIGILRRRARSLSPAAEALLEAIRLAAAPLRLLKSR